MVESTYQSANGEEEYDNMDDLTQFFPLNPPTPPRPNSSLKKVTLLVLLLGLF